MILDGQEFDLQSGAAGADSLAGARAEVAQLSKSSQLKTEKEEAEDIFESVDPLDHDWKLLILMVQVLEMILENDDHILTLQKLPSRRLNHF